MSSCCKIFDLTVLPNLYKEMASWLVNLLDSIKSRGISWSVRCLTDRQWEIKEIPGCQAQNDWVDVTTAYHTNQPHYARSEVLMTIALKIWGSKSSDYEDYAVLRCYPRQLPTKLQCITRQKRVFFNYIILTSISSLSKQCHHTCLYLLIQPLHEYKLYN